jgi:hypothetical protein
MKSIYELIGGAITSSRYDQSTGAQGPVGQAPPNAPNQPNTLHMFPPSQISVGFKLKQGHQLYPWQNQIINQLKGENGRDTFIMTQSPGGGKTLPVIIYWAQEILGINVRLEQDPNLLQSSITNFKRLIDEPQNIPQILWCSPIRQLNHQIVFDEFTKDFAILFLQYFNSMIFRYIQDNPNDQSKFPIELLMTFIHMASSSDQHQEANTLDFVRQEILRVKQELLNHQQGDPYYNSLMNELQRLINSVFEACPPIIENFIKRKLIGMKFKGYDTTGAASGSIKKPVVISIYESIKESKIIDSMDNIKLIVFDEIQTSQKTGVKDTDARAEQISDAIHFTLLSPKAKQARLVVLTGTQYVITAKNFINFLNSTYGRNFSDPFVSSAANLATIKVFDLDDLQDFRYVKDLVKTLLSHSRKQVGVVLFSIKRINEIVDYCAQGSGQSNFHPIPPSPGFKEKFNYRGKRVTEQNPYFDESDVDIVRGQPHISLIKNDFLRQAAISKIAVLYRLKDNDPDFERNKYDNMIIQELYTRGDLNILLATDSIGSGMNVSIRDLYIPSVEKQGELITKTPLAQLIHRVGRISQNCRIYTPSKFVPDIMAALNATDLDFYYPAGENETYGIPKPGLRGLLHPVATLKQILQSRF